ncbi:hypothetical protein N7481_012308 [Penicillium waksmanii]|uniref:uncharacterized protein n=1 Tax=Penicillium waksmanii TaxID=69791 RepID=UPI002548F936|nr:uncharacterized protein N7481_012308 [Penicillium waksmanii]KAJ5965594.1 hypothetical protein N7481_012308 [Penicillium waksmanii]
MFRIGFGLRTICLVPTVILFCLISASSATCYFPNGEVGSDYRQCPGGLSCCLKGESCLSNGFCFGANLGILYRGLCADETWPIALCPRACYEEIDDGWANLFQCNTSNTLWTCSHEISAPVACQEKNALGTFHYTSANVTAAQNGMPTSENTTSSATSCETANRTATVIPTLATSDASSTCPSIVSYNKTQLAAIGAGLGAGLGIPLLLVGGLLLYCSQAKRRQKEQLQYGYPHQAHMSENSSQDMKRQTGSKWKPSELHSSFAGNELAGSTQGRSELPGSFGMI